MVEYTSGQYKYLLFQRLRRSFSMLSQQDRAYTQTFFLELFDGVTVTKMTYDNFVSMMDQQLQHLAELGVYEMEDIPQDEIESGSLLLIDAFAQIGITLIISEPENDDGTYKATFIKSNGQTLVYSVIPLTLKNAFCINARAGTEYKYATASAPFYRMDDQDVLDADGMEHHISGPGTFWSYASADNGSMTISGEGAYVGATVDAQLGGGPFATLIIGADVSRLVERCMMSSEAVLVLLTPADGQIAIDADFNIKEGECSSSRIPLDVYTDCLAAREILSGEDFAESITLHPLSEWEG